MNKLFLGIDVSTQGCKVLCIDPALSKKIYLDGLNYDKDLPGYNTLNGAARNSNAALSESNPMMWLEALQILFQRMKQQNFPMQEIAAISVSGQQHGLVTLDASGNLTRPLSKLWNDFSTSEECDILTEKIGGIEKMIEAVGNSKRPGYTAGKIFHMFRHEPAAAEQTSTFFLVHNFINWYLTGGKDGGVRAMEPGDVSGMALRHPGSNEWSREVCNAISPTLISKLPPVYPADQAIGKISAALVEAFGFSPDCQIDAGCGDNMYGAIGTGNIAPGIVTISLGTSGTAYTIFEDPYADPDGEIAAFCDSTGKYLPLLCVSNLANGYNQIIRQFALTHQTFSDVINQTSPGNEGRLLFPWFMGERTPNLPFATPVYWGFQADDFTRENLCRAVLEGPILNLHDGYRKMPVAAREIRLTGGLSQSDAWCQTIADIFDCETVPVEGEGAALGAAIHAAWVYTRETENPLSLEALSEKYITIQESRRKDPVNARVHARVKGIFREVSQRLRSANSAFDPFRNTHQLRGNESQGLLNGIPGRAKL